MFVYVIVVFVGAHVLGAFVCMSVCTCVFQCVFVVFCVYTCK